MDRMLGLQLLKELLLLCPLDGVFYDLVHRDRYMLLTLLLSRDFVLAILVLLVHSGGKYTVEVSVGKSALPQYINFH